MEEIELESPVPAPAWLLERIAAPAAPKPENASADATIVDGERNTALASMAGAMRRKGMGEESILAALDRENKTRCSPPLADSEVHKIAHSITRYPPTEPVSWESPISFQNHRLPSFPTHALPAWLRNFVEGEAEATQTPVDMPAVVVLAVCACVCAKKFILRVCSGWLEPLNLFLAVVMPPGSRKTRVFQSAEEPLREYEEELATLSADEIAEAETRHRIALGKLQKLQAKASSSEGPEAEQLTKAAAELSKEVSGMRIPVVPRIVADDVTPERLATLIKEQCGRMALLSAECGLFDLMAGRYSKDGSPNFEIYLKAHAGDTLRVDRVGRPPEYVPHPALTIGLAVQPEVLAGLIERQGFKGRGVLGRILYSLPPNFLGRRKIGMPPLPDEIRNIYKRNIRRLLALPFDKNENGHVKSHTLRLSQGAVARFREFEAWVEPQLAELGQLGHMCDWGGKLAGAVARIAGLLHIAEHADEPCPWNIEVSPETVARAISIGEYFIPHARAAYADMGAAPALADAKRILAWIRRQTLPEFTKRQVFQIMKGYFKRVSQLEPALLVLEEHGYIKQKVSEHKPGAGRKPSPVYQVNSIWLAQKSDSEDFGNSEEQDKAISSSPISGNQPDFEDIGDSEDGINAINERHGGNSEDSENDHQKDILDRSISILDDKPQASGQGGLSPIVAPQNPHNPQNCPAAPETASFFSPEEAELLKDCTEEDLAGLASLKEAFPGCVVRAVEPAQPEEPVSEAERKAQEMEAYLKEVCRRRNLVFADIERLWPAIEKRRRQQRKEERENEKRKNEKPGW